MYMFVCLCIDSSEMKVTIYMMKFLITNHEKVNKFYVYGSVHHNIFL